MEEHVRLALIDLDNTVADLSGSLSVQMLRLQAPGEPPYQDRYTGGKEPDYIEQRRKLIMRQPGFWRGLPLLRLGIEIVCVLREEGFALHVLTKGPQNNAGAWGEKLEWARDHLPDAIVTVTGDKSIAYGRILVDDYPPYFLPWLQHRPRGLAICVAQPHNEQFAMRGAESNPRVFRYDGKNLTELRAAIREARDR